MAEKMTGAEAEVETAKMWIDFLKGEVTEASKALLARIDKHAAEIKAERAELAQQFGGPRIGRGEPEPLPETTYVRELAQIANQEKVNVRVGTIDICHVPVPGMLYAPVGREFERPGMAGPGGVPGPVPPVGGEGQ